MFQKIGFLQSLLLITLMLISCGVLSAGVADADSEIASAAIKEGNLFIYGTVDKKTAQLLVNEFEILYPGIKVDFIDMSASEVFTRHMNDLAGRRVSADILWSGDITLQAALVKDGFALRYSPERSSNVMPLAYLGDTAFVTGFEPAVFAYNKKLAAAGELPATRKQLLKTIEKAEWRGKLASCDPEKNALAFLLLTQDFAYGQNFWGMVGKLGDAGLKLYPDYPTLLERIASGEVMAGYNLPLSEVLKRAGPDADIGWLYLSDYTLVIPQSVLITKAATHPQAARLWVDFLHSGKAQQLIAEHGDLYPVAVSAAGGSMKKHGGELPPATALKVIGTGAEVTRFGESGLKKGFLLRWKQKLKLVK